MKRYLSGLTLVLARRVLERLEMCTAVPILLQRSKQANLFLQPFSKQPFISIIIRVVQAGK